MTDKTQKSKSKKKPKLSEEEKREKVRETLLKKKAYETRALALVEQLLETNIKGEWLVSVSPQLSLSHYQDAVEERSLVKLCGYPLCDQPHDASKVRQKFHISTLTNKVYDVEERKLFCSSLCFKSSNFFKDQLETSPLWLREVETPVFAKLYTEKHEGEKESTLKNYNQDDDQNNTAQKPTPPKTFTSARDRSASNQSKEDLGTTVRETLISWFTIDSFRLVAGEDRLREEVQKKRGEPWPSIEGDPALQEQYQAGIRDLARRLDLLEIAEEQEEEEAERLPLPSFEMLKRHQEEENKKLASFLAGRSSYQTEEPSKIVENVEEEVEPRLPPLDHHGQTSLRRGIVMEGLQRALPPLLTTLGISYASVRAPLKELVASFQLSATTITFSSDGWRLLSLSLLGLLRSPDMKQTLQSPKLYHLLESLGQSSDYLDIIAAELTSDVNPLLEKYEISFSH